MGGNLAEGPLEGLPAGDYLPLQLGEGFLDAPNLLEQKQQPCEKRHVAGSPWSARLFWGTPRPASWAGAAGPGLSEGC